MIRKAVILLSLCCAVLCGITGYMSYQATQKPDETIGETVPMSCEEVLEFRLSKTSLVTLTDFSPGKYLAYVDDDGDDQWNRLCVPFFSPQRRKIGYGYNAVLVCFKDVPTREALESLMENEELNISFWPDRQQLDLAIHSQLAQHYKNLDIAKSPVFYHGFDAANPILGESTMRVSAGLGSVAILVAFLTMIYGLWTRTKSTEDFESENSPTTNRAGLPMGGETSFLDQIGSTASAVGK